MKCPSIDFMQFRLFIFLVSNPCLPSPCLNNGTCVNKGIAFECHCPGAFSGKRCESK